MTSHFSVKVFGVGVWGLSINLTLEGPAPWHAKGRASISLLFFDIAVSFDQTWGERRGEILQPVFVLPLLKIELGKKENWRAFLPEDKTDLVTLRKFTPEENTLVLHPAGKLRVLQKLVPLDISITKLGNQKIVDGKKFSLSVVAGEFHKNANAKERFAAAQFNDLSDDQRLSSPAFEEQNGGLDLTPAANSLFSATAIKRSNRYELNIVDTQGRRHRKRFHGLNVIFGARLLCGSAAALSSLSAQTGKQKNPFTDKVINNGEKFAVAFADTNTVFKTKSNFSSEASAREYLQSTLAADPTLADRIHILPTCELVA
jgi:hypothetical protein